MKLDDLKRDFATLDSRVSRLEAEADNPNYHFESMLSHPNLIASWTLRRNEDYLTISRGVNSPLRTYKTTNPGVRYDVRLDAARVSLPPLTNELGPDGNAGISVGQFGCSWKIPDWEVGSKVVVQYEVLMSQAMHDLAPAVGINGRSSPLFKFVNLCRGAGQVTYELRTYFKSDPIDTLLDVRGYDAGLKASSLEGIVGRDNLVAPLSGTAFDMHPGPDSSRPSNANPPHPTQFRMRSNRWVRITCEMEKVSSGTRFKMWASDDETEPKLIIASPSNPSSGFLTSVVDPIEVWFCQLDTSQETVYAAPMPERWCAFRNLLVLSNASGESILGGKTRAAGMLAK
jgi:hypothetical protein